MRFIRPYAMALGMMAFSPISSAQTELNLCDSNLPVLVTPGSGQTYALTREESEKAINCLARVSDKEDSWIHDGIYLYDTGEQEYAGLVTVDTDFLFDEIISASNSHKFFNYHNHPASAINISPPSIDDFNYHMTESYFLSRFGVKVESGVADGFGIWYYSVEPNENFGIRFDGDKVIAFTKIDVIYQIDELVKCLKTLDITRDEKTQIFIDEVSKFGAVLSYRRIDAIK